MDYFCDRCGYTTKYPGRFSIHLNKKNPCKPILKDISIEIIKDNFLQNNKKNTIVKTVDIQLMINHILINISIGKTLV